MASRLQTRKAANLSISGELLAEAKRLKVNISRAAEEGITKAVAEARMRAWRRENAAAIESWNAHVAEKGLPLARHRQF